MEKLRSAARKLGLELSPEQIARFEVYHRELADWNRRMNLTAITDYEEVQVKHFLDSLSVVLAWRPKEAQESVIDVGTGAGLPGIPLKIVFPEIKLALLDSIAKKTVFLEHLVRELALSDIKVLAGRAEEMAQLPEYREAYSLVVSRALAKLSTLVELTLPFCAVGGRVIVLKKAGLSAELENASRAIELLGGRLAGTTEVNLAELPDRRQLIVIDKVLPTPGKFPRRSGIPGKRPL